MRPRITKAKSSGSFFGDEFVGCFDDCAKWITPASDAGVHAKPKITCNARIEPKELKTFYALNEPTKELLKQAMAELNLSARAYDRILKMARTIEDLAGTENISQEHISEAIQYRSLDRQLWT